LRNSAIEIFGESNKICLQAKNKKPYVEKVKKTDKKSFLVFENHLYGLQNSFAFVRRFFAKIDNSSI
jgi:hypothetical protein